MYALKKLDKLGAEYDKVKRENETLTASMKEKSEGMGKDKEALNENIRQLRRDKEEGVRAAKAEKENIEKIRKELQRRLVEAEEELAEYKDKFGIINRKVAKIEESRAEEVARLSQKVT